MAERSGSKVTITLGRGRQVVKNAGLALDSTSESTVGRKRPVRDRLGADIGFSSNKRLRGNGGEFSTSSSNCIDDTGLSKDDLRFKIMQKKMHKKTESDEEEIRLDLRNMLSRPAQSSTTSVGEGHRMLERKQAKQHFVEPRDGREYISQPKNPRLHMAENRDGMQYMSRPRESRPQASEVRDGRNNIAEFRDTRTQIDGGSRHRVADIGQRHRMADIVDSRSCMDEVRHSYMLERKDVRQHVPEPYSLSMTGRISSSGVDGSVTPIDTLKKSYSPWTLEGLRRRSPDGVMSSSRRFSPQRRDGELRRPTVGSGSYNETRVGFSPPRRDGELRRPTVGSYNETRVGLYNDTRVGSYMSKDSAEFSHPLASASYMPTTIFPPGSSKVVAPPLAPPMPPGSHRSSYPVDDHQLTVERFLYSLGLEKFAINFKAEEVDMYALKQMGDGDLKDLGIPMGPRRKILLALQPRPKQPPI